MEDGPAAAKRLLDVMTPAQIERLAHWIDTVKQNRFGQVTITLHDGEIHMMQAMFSEKVSRKAAAKKGC